MKLTHILIKNFRNLIERDFFFDEKTVINGPNGSGKTSIIEAAYFSFTGRSFRTSNTKELINREKKVLFIRSETVDFSGFQREISVGFDSSGQRKILIDGINSSRKDLMNVVFPVIHTPEDMEIIQGGPKRRRDFIDRICFMENRSYFDDMVEYSRYIRQKNILLKKKDGKTVSYLNKAALPLIKRIRDFRKTACEMISNEFKIYNSDIFPELNFSISCPQDEETEEKLRLRLSRELEKGYAMYGPHLDNIVVKTELCDSRSGVSMGEAYLISLVLKMSELSLYSKKELYPVFFIDDLFVFLDGKRKNDLYSRIVKLKNQVIMTSSTETSCDFKEILFNNISDGGS